MELIERYIYAVTQKLPASQREDIGVELRGLIEDMLEEYTQGKSVSQSDVEEILLKLGNPKELADKYRGTKKYLIGPEIFDTFLLVLKIVLISLVSVTSVIFLIEIMFKPESILEFFVDYLIDMINGLPMAFGWTTFAFFIVQYFAEKEISNELKKNNSWAPTDLPPVPDPKGRIKRSEPIVGIVFYTLFIGYLISARELFGVWRYVDGTRNVIPFLNENASWIYLLLVLIIFGFGIIKECLKLAYGKWTWNLVIFTAITNLVSLISILYLIAQPDVWNPTFMEDLVQLGILMEGSESYTVVNKVWDTLPLWTLILFAFGLVWDAVDGFIKIRIIK